MPFAHLHQIWRYSDEMFEMVLSGTKPCIENNWQITPYDVTVTALSLLTSNLVKFSGWMDATEMPSRAIFCRRIVTTLDKNNRDFARCTSQGIKVAPRSREDSEVKFVAWKASSIRRRDSRELETHPQLWKINEQYARIHDLQGRSSLYLVSSLRLSAPLSLPPSVSIPLP